MARPTPSVTQRQTTSVAKRANRGRTRELLIWACFSLIAALAVATVLLPETQDEKEPGDAAGTGQTKAPPAHTHD